LWFSTKRAPTCPLTICSSFLLYQSAPMKHLPLQHLILLCQSSICCKDKIKICRQFSKNNEWPSSLSKLTIRNLETLAPKVCFDKNKLAWIRLEDHKHPQTVLWLPERYHKEALCETHDSIFARHNAALKSVYSHVLKHTQTCLHCQQRKTAKKKNQPLAPLPIPDTPNSRIHTDLFGPMVDASRRSACILCITDAFTKYTVVTSIPNKDAQTVAKAMFEQWFCMFGIPAQIHRRWQGVCQQITD
jgi:hypothetical protein